MLHTTNFIPITKKMASIAVRRVVTKAVFFLNVTAGVQRQDGRSTALGMRGGRSTEGFLADLKV